MIAFIRNLFTRVERARIEELARELGAQEARQIAKDRADRIYIRALTSHIGELEEDLQEREDAATLTIAMGREMAKDADGSNGQSADWQACARYYRARYREILVDEETEGTVDAGPINVDANGSEVQS